MDVITEALKTMVLNMIELNLTLFFTTLSSGIDRATTEMMITPTGWLGGAVWSFMEQIAENIMMPIAGLILTFILVMEIYHTVMEKNAMQEIHIPTLLMYFFKMAFGLMIVSYSTRIVPALFELGTWAVSGVSGIVATTMESSPAGVAGQVVTMLEADTYDLGVCFMFWLIAFLALVLAFVINIVASLVVYMRLLQMVLYSSFAPVPMATFMNKDWNMGQNYIKNLLALAFQGVLIIIIFGVYSIVASTSHVDTSGGIEALLMSIMGIVGWGVLLIMALLKTNSVTNSIFGAH